jgi:hypothetical protein
MRLRGYVRRSLSPESTSHRPSCRGRSASYPSGHNAFRALREPLALVTSEIASQQRLTHLTPNVYSRPVAVGLR